MEGYCLCHSSYDKLMPKMYRVYWLLSVHRRQIVQCDSICVFHINGLVHISYLSLNERPHPSTEREQVL